MKGLNTFALKLIAVISMLIDHVGMMFFPEQMVFRIIGRLAFPIFAYILTEGFWYTKNVWKYALRLLIFAVLSEIPFDLFCTGKCFDFLNQNIFFTLLIGLLMMIGIIKVKKTWVSYLVVVLAMVVSDLLFVDYGSIGILAIWIFFRFRNFKPIKIVGIGALMLWSGLIQGFGVLAMVPISLHNRKQGPKMKYFFYLFYPIHLLVLYFIQLLI